MLSPHLFSTVFLLLFVFVFAVPIEKSYYWDTRTIECVNTFGNITRCSLKTTKRTEEVNPNCFEELDKKNQTRVYCSIGCEESDETTVLQKIPSWNHKCNVFYNYNLERRRRDWYLWRSSQCAITTVSFQIRCGFPRNPKVFYRQNVKLFEYEDAE